MVLCGLQISFWLNDAKLKAYIIYLLLSKSFFLEMNSMELTVSYGELELFLSYGAITYSNHMQSAKTAVDISVTESNRAFCSDKQPVKQ